MGIIRSKVHISDLELIPEPDKNNPKYANSLIRKLKAWKKANKIEIAKAVAEIFKVKVDNVTTVNVTGKKKRVGRFTGKRPDYKKAVVKLAAGETIEFFSA